MNKVRIIIVADTVKGASSNDILTRIKDNIGGLCSDIVYDPQIEKYEFIEEVEVGEKK